MIHSMLYTPEHGRPMRVLASLLNLLVLLGCLVILLMFTLQILYPKEYAEYALFEQVKFWICIAFLADIVVRFVVSPHKLRFMWRNLIFFLVSVPYLFIFTHLDITITPSLSLFLHALLLLRGGYGLVVVVSWVTTSRITNLLLSYLLVLLASTYFASLVFYEMEHSLNSAIVSYADALWWACMDVTTVGSTVNPVTPVGRVLSVLLAALGMCMFPIVTAFITNKFQK